MSDEHEAFIKTPRQLIIVVVLAFVVPVVVILLLAFFVDVGPRWGTGADTMSSEAVEARIRPVAGFELVDASTPREERSGEQVYDTICATCHAAGVAGAPRIGDNEAWAARIEAGLDTLIASSLHGKGLMPPQGGGEFSDQEIVAAVVHLANASGASFEPPQPAEAQQQTADAGAAAPAQGTATSGAGTATPGAAAAPTAQADAATPAAVASGTAAAAAGAAAPTAPATRDQAASPSGGAVASGDGPAQTASAAPAGDAAAASGEGKKIYDTTCALCHNTGLAGAPKLGDKAAWEPLIAEGLDHLVDVSITGIGAMPPRGGNPNLSDADMRVVVEYMVSTVQ